MFIASCEQLAAFSSIRDPSFRCELIANLALTSRFGRLCCIMSVTLLVRFCAASRRTCGIRRRHVKVVESRPS